jgi:hypothetical protein
MFLEIRIGARPVQFLTNFEVQNRLWRVFQAMAIQAFQANPNDVIQCPPRYYGYVSHHS